MYEPIFYLYGKNAKDLNFTPETYGETQQNVWEIATPQSNFNEGKYHPAQKPLELYKRIIQTGSFENDTILDCFAGSGTTGIICNELKRNCFLIENSPENIQIIKGRINNG
jgi:site-specific DNA-methyltransferase (adenine-specific)